MSTAALPADTSNRWDPSEPAAAGLTGLEGNARSACATGIPASETATTTTALHTQRMSPAKHALVADSGRYPAITLRIHGAPVSSAHCARTSCRHTAEVGWLRRSWGEFVGPEAAAVENAGTLSSAAAGAVLAPRLDAGRPRGSVATIGLSLLAMDIWGGAWANNTRSCARWYERPGQGTAQHLAFAAVHVDPFVLAGYDRGLRTRTRSVVWAGVTYGYMLAATSVIRRYPTHRRWLGIATTLGAVALDQALGPSPTAPWFAPAFAKKLLLGHASAALWSDAALTATAES